MECHDVQPAEKEEKVSKQLVSAEKYILCPKNSEAGRLSTSLLR